MYMYNGSVFWFETKRPCCYVFYLCHFRLFDGTTPVLLVADIESFKQILVKDFHIFTDRVVSILGTFLSFSSCHEQRDIIIL